MNDMNDAAAPPSFPMPRTGSPFDPPVEYDRFRQEGPLRKVRMWDGRDAWLVTRMADVRAVLANLHFSNNPAHPGYPFLSPARAETLKNYQTFITMDPPDHTRLRRMLTKDFTQKRMEEMRPGIEKLVDGMIDDMIAKGPPADLVQDLALKLPVTVLSLLVGVPGPDRDQLVKWSADRLNITLEAHKVTQATHAMLQYFDELVRRREQHPGEAADTVSRLVVEQIQPGHLSRKAAVHMLDLLFFAGHETTANQIELGVLSLMLHPQQRAELASDPACARNAVEEMLRYHTPTHYHACRVATADTTVGGQPVRAGEGVFALLTAANRDPAVFAQPDQFDIARKNAPDHVTFSYGIHQCLGQPLARLELQTVFQKIFQRLPRLALAVPFEDISFKKEMYIYGLRALPVTW